MPKITPRTFKGTRDYLPAEMLRREQLFQYLRGVFQRYGFAPLETPAFEFMEILLGKYGVEGEKLIYPLAYRDARTLALRYDLTVPLARCVAEHGDLPRPFKRYQMQPVWRGDQPQLARGRYREFYQCDADIVGEASLLADAEILALSAEILAGLEIPNYRLRVNHRRILEGVVAHAGLPPEAGPAVLRAIDKLDKIEIAGVEKELETAGFEAPSRRQLLDVFSRPEGGRAEIEAFGKTYESQEAIRKGTEDLLAIWSALEAMGGASEVFEFQVSLARGLDYYTGTVYESVSHDLPQLGSLSGGGRYDGLVGLFSDDDVPAVGMAVGFDRVFTALEQLGKTPTRSSHTEVMVLQFEAGSERPALGLLGRLRAAGIRAEIWYRPDRLGKQIQQADKRGIPIVVFQGPDEAARGEWSVKILSSGEQQVAADHAVVEQLGRAVAALTPSSGR